MCTAAKRDIRVSKIADVTNDVFNECLETMLTEDNNQSICGNMEN